MKQIRLSPIPGGSLTHASGSYSSMHGKIISTWKKESDYLFYHFEIPVNTRAKVTLKAPKSDIYGEDNQPLGEIPDIYDPVLGSGEITFTIGSGTYDFKVPQ